MESALSTGQDERARRWSAIRRAGVGDLLPSSLAGRTRARRLEARAILLPGLGGVGSYSASLEAHRADFGAWDGDVRVLEPDGAADHRLVIVDRYRQVYAIHDAADVADLPAPDVLVEWFRFLATACPECGVLDDPLLTGPTP